jgi:Xaa-Pro aminopeptidase
LIIQKNTKPTKKGVIFVDSRYTLQAKKQCVGFEVVECDNTQHRIAKIQEWMCSNLPESATIAYANFSVHQFSQLYADCPMFKFISIDTSLMKLEQHYQIEQYNIEYSGRSCLDKINDFVKSLCKEVYDKYHNCGILLSSCDSIAWLFNLRSKNLVRFSPAFPSLSIITRDKVFLLIPPNSLNIDEFNTSEYPNIAVYQININDYGEQLRNIIENTRINTLLFDASQLPQYLYELLSSMTNMQQQTDQILAQRSIKNNVEIENSIIVHKAEGAAIVELLAWIDSYNWHSLTELNIAEKLEEIRKKNVRYKGPSFRSIIATGENAAIVHYSPIECIPLKQNVLLIDVGGNYYGATTDMTRTIWIGRQTPPNYIIDSYTRVLRGHIALALAEFPSGTTGAQVDILARQFLWKNQQNYTHATGHGVGNYLTVHEGNLTISPQNFAYPFVSGMIVSNEPGYYENDNYGIRLENLMLVRDKLKNFLSFAMLTMVPFDFKLIKFDLLTHEERAWLKTYHELVLNNLESLKSNNSAWSWLEHASEPFLD